MAVDYGILNKCYYTIRRDKLADGTERIWKIELRPANELRDRNLMPGDAPCTYEELNDLIVDKIECLESSLERQMGLQTPPTLKITLALDYAEPGFAAALDQSGDYENSQQFSPLSYEFPKKILYNTWLISYSDDAGETWSWWFAGVQQPNEVTKYQSSTLTGNTVKTLEITVQHITHWILTQITYGEWGEQLIYAGSILEDFDFRLANIVYDTIFQEDFLVEARFGSRTETRTVNFSSNWGVTDSRPEKDEAYIVRWRDAFDCLRGILNKSLRAHRVSSPTDALYATRPMMESVSEPPYGFYAQNYDSDGGLGAALGTIALWVIAAVKPENSTDYMFGLWVDTLKSNGAGFDGETCVDAIENLAKSFACKALYRTYTDGAGDPVFSLNSRPFRGPCPNVKTLSMIDDFQQDWVFERGEFIARGAAFNVSVEGDNGGEFRVYKGGNQNRQDIEAKMQMHNLPNINDYTLWQNPEATAPHQSYRRPGYTLRHLLYLDQPTGLLAAPFGWADGDMPIRVHEYAAYYDGVKLWDHTHGNPFVAVPRTDKTIKSDMLLMQRKAGMPNITANVLSEVFTRSSLGKFTGRCSINKIDYNDVGAQIDMIVPDDFTRAQNGMFYVESAQPDFKTLTSDCILIFIPNDPE